MDIRQEIREEGIQEGLQAGRQEGLQVGRQEGMQAVALNMLKKEAEVSYISEMTGLSEDQINKLKKKD